MLHPQSHYNDAPLSILSCLIQSSHFQARFFLANADLLPRAEDDLDEHVSNPRSKARTPKPRKGA